MTIDRLSGFDPTEYARRYWSWSRESWFALPLELRRRWWRETNYSQRPPSEALVRAIWEALGVIEPRKPPPPMRASNLATLKAAMAAAHPDKGGSSAAFIEARQRYVAARRAHRSHA